MRKKGRGDIVKVGDLFEVYKKRLHAPEGVVIKTFQEVVEDLFSVKIPTTHCSYTVSTQMLAVRTSGPLKAEILMRKKEILAHLTARLEEKSAPKDIL